MFFFCFFAFFMRTAKILYPRKLVQPSFLYLLFISVNPLIRDQPVIANKLVHRFLLITSVEYRGTVSELELIGLVAVKVAAQAHRISSRSRREIHPRFAVAIEATAHANFVGNHDIPTLVPDIIIR